MTCAWRYVFGPMLLIALTPYVRGADAPMQPKGRVIGRVTVEGAGAPVAGAKVPITVGPSQEWPGVQYEVVDGITDNDGRYSAEVPLGHVWINAVELPAGYWFRSVGIENAATSRAQPTIEKNFEVSVGASWPVRVTLENGEPLPEGMVFISETKENGFGKATSDADGKALMPLPAEGGELEFALISDQPTVLPLSAFKLQIDKGFDPQSVVEVNRSKDQGTFQVIDKAGHGATVEGPNVALVDGQAQLQIVVRKGKPFELGALVGKVVDEQGRPVPKAPVVLQGPVLPPLSGGRVHTNDRGEFRVENIARKGYPRQLPEYRLIVTKDGYIDVETEPQRFQPDDNGLQQLDQPIVLKPGYSARVRVLSKDGEPVEGAWLMPAGGSAVGAQLIKTDVEGRATLRGLPEGVQGAHVYYGNQSAYAKVVITRKETGDVATIRLRPSPPDPAEVVNRELPKPLKAGETAPEWSVVEWTDGKTRKLSDLRGKVVVMDFWGVWCSPCINSIPAKKKVLEKYRGKDIVFIGMHTAGTDMSQIKSLLELKEWNLLTALEEGTDQIDSATSLRYGVHTYPTTVIIDRKGRIATNTADDETIGDKEKVMAKVEVMAKEAGLPWPISEDWPEEKTQDWLLKMNEYRLSKEIDKALVQD
ncbi:MAG: redoxin family protein [Pirellulales bacterium]